jgi:hypothetical protein
MCSRNPIDNLSRNRLPEFLELLRQDLLLLYQLEPTLDSSLSSSRAKPEETASLLYALISASFSLSPFGNVMTTHENELSNLGL